MDTLVDDEEDPDDSFYKIFLQRRNQTWEKYMHFEKLKNEIKFSSERKKKQMNLMHILEKSKI